MDFEFPVFVPASSGAAPAIPTQKSLWQLVIESGQNNTLSDCAAPELVAAALHSLDSGHEGANDRKNGTNGHAERRDALETATAAQVASRSSWTPSPYMVQHLLSSGFVSQFCMLHGIECSARVPPPPCMRLEDLQLPPFLLRRLRRQLPMPPFRGEERSTPGAFPMSQRPGLRELQAIVFSGGADATPDGAALHDDEEGEKDVVLTALQQLTLTSMLLGHHTVSIAPKGTGKKTSGLLATAAMTLARGVRNVEDCKQEEVKREPTETLTIRPPAPCAMILVSNFSEVRHCNRWLQEVFTAEAFAPMTFRRGTTELVPLPMIHGTSCGYPRVPPPMAEMTLPAAMPIPLPVPLPLIQGTDTQRDDGVGCDSERHYHCDDHCGYNREDRENRKRSRDSLRDSHRRHRRGHGELHAAREKVRRRHRSSSSHRLREKRHRRSRSHSRHRDHKRRRSRSHRRHRHRGDSSGRENRRSTRGSHHHHEKKRKTGGDHHNDSSHHRLPSEHVPECSSGTPQAKTVDRTAIHESPAAKKTLHEEVPHFLQERVPILIAAHQSLIEALQIVQGQAEALPIECIRVVCISDADRMAQPTSHNTVPVSWWISLSNAVDVDCQYIVSAPRMYDEINGWLQETVLRDTPDVVNCYRQREDTVWCGVQHVLDVVPVEETHERTAQPMFERVEMAKLQRLVEIIARHFRPSRASDMDFVHSDDSNAAASPSPSLKGSVGCVVVVVSSRKEQESVFPQLQSGLQERAARLRCTCHLADLQRGDADVLVTYDWVLCASMDDSRDGGGSRGGNGGLCRPVDVVVNFGFPRVLLSPGKEESLLECLMIRARTLLHQTASAPQWSEGGKKRAGEFEGSFFAEAASETRAQPTVLTLLTERQMHGWMGRLLMSRAQALSLD